MALEMPRPGQGGRGAPAERAGAGTTGLQQIDEEGGGGPLSTPFSSLLWADHARPGTRRGAQTELSALRTGRHARVAMPLAHPPGLCAMLRMRCNAAAHGGNCVRCCCSQRQP